MQIPYLTLWKFPYHIGLFPMIRQNFSLDFAHALSLFYTESPISTTATTDTSGK